MAVSSETDLSRLRINRDAPPRRRWLPVASGYVVARHSSDVGVKVGGRIAALKFEEGTRVKKGAVIAELEHADIDAQLEAARRAVIDGAPFDGVVIKKRAEVGETVSPFGVAGQAAREGGAIATIADLAELEVQTEVSENNVAKLKPSMPAYRTREIGTLRALGFSRFRIVTAFLAESIALAAIGGIIGCALALPVHGLSTGTTNFSSFSEVAFKFRITPLLMAGGLFFAALMGTLGGLLPALRAARIPVARALREI